MPFVRFRLKSSGEGMGSVGQSDLPLLRSMVNIVARQISKCAEHLRCAALRVITVVLAIGLLSNLSAHSATTGVWSPTGNSGGTATVNGVTVTVSGVTSTAAAATNTLNATNFWTNPYGAAVNGGPSLQMQPNPYGTTQTVTITFSRPVNDPVIHWDRIGGSIGTAAATSVWTLSSFTATSGTVTPSLLSGNPVMKLTGAGFQRDTVPAVAAAAAGECLADNTGTACGSVKYTGTSITKLVFTVTWAGTSNTTTGDGMELAVSVPSTSVLIKKQSNFGTATFNYSGTNGIVATPLNTATTNPITSAAMPMTDVTVNTTIAEAATPGYVLSSASCIDQTAAAVTSSLAGSTLTIAASAINPVSLGQNITCTFINDKLPTVALTKISNGAVGGFTFTGTNGWTSQTITTATSGTGVTGATQSLTAASTATTITEAIPAGYQVTSIFCTGLGSGGAATPNLNTGAVVLDAAATAMGSNIACTFTNAKLPTLQLTKISNGGVGGFTFTGTNGWTNQTITTTTAGTGVTGAAQTLSAAATATTITDGMPAGYGLASVTCTGMGP
jgi:hypothetical protein